jgi:catechol 2,3-dioxygenase-like lactoylglutathione lyase family enzyme
MAINGIDAVTFGVADMDAAHRFCLDWGLAEVEAGRDRLLFRTRDGGEVIVRPADAPDLPSAIEAGNTVREITWGAANEADLKDTLDRLRARGVLVEDNEVYARDPNGLRLSFRLSRRRPVAVTPTPVNAPGAHNRVDRRSPIHERAEPIQIGHVVLYRPGKPGVNHVAFTVTDIHEVIGGGIAMAKKGWKTEIGPGRHPISSAYFWYFHNPLGAPVEYYADDDFCTENWKPGQFVRKPELFAEWAIAGGIDGTTRRQVVAQDDSGRGHA